MRGTVCALGRKGGVALPPGFVWPASRPGSFSVAEGRIKKERKLPPHRNPLPRVIDRFYQHDLASSPTTKAISPTSHKEPNPTLHVDCVSEYATRKRSENVTRISLMYYNFCLGNEIMHATTIISEYIQHINQ